MLTPAQRHFQKVMAERRGQVSEESDIQRTAHEQILHRLRLDQARLKGVQSDATKAEMKRSMLPEYAGWIEGTIESDSGRQDEVISTLMVWAIDCQDYPLALSIGGYVVRHGLSLPDNFNRDAATFFVEELSNPILTLAATDVDADLSGYTDMLDSVAGITADSDMPDVVRAKLCKARGLSRRGFSDIDSKAEALKLFREAMARNPNAGVKKEIATLTRELKKATLNNTIDGESTVASNGATGEEPPMSTSPDKKTPVRKSVPKTLAKKAPRKPASRKKN